MPPLHLHIISIAADATVYLLNVFLFKPGVFGFLKFSDTHVENVRKWPVSIFKSSVHFFSPYLLQKDKH